MSTNGDRLDKQAETMARVTVRLPSDLEWELERAVDDGEYPHRSAAIRAGVRAMLEGDADV